MGARRLRRVLALRLAQHRAALARCLGALVDGLCEGGVPAAVICPGSRSTPVALALLRHGGLRIYTHLDERSAAFFALGLARGLDRPVAVLATSGTAAANFLPAAVEARHGGVPLVLLTADRPPELRDVGANQTIDQLHLYGRQAKWFQELPVPALGLERLFRFAGARAAWTARTAPAGPVHLNLPLREPLLPSPGRGTARAEWGSGQVAVLEPGRWAAAAPPVLPDRPRGVIVAGASDLRPIAQEVLALARALGWPVLADPLSNLRGLSELVVTSYDVFLRSPRVAQALLPDQVIRWGAPPTSKALAGLIARRPQTVVDDPGRFRDPTLSGARFAWGRVVGSASGPKAPEGWLHDWQAADRACRQALARGLAGLPSDAAQRFEGALFAGLPRLVPAGQAVVVGNSLPVRDLDAFYPGGDLVLFANRGASGIDGVVSTALGIGAARGPVLLVLGDLSFLHDANGLIAARLNGVGATVVVLHNDGGGIFSLLPQSTLDPATFERLFGTPHGLSFAGLAAMYGAFFRATERLEEVAAAVRARLGAPGVSVIEWRTLPRGDNASLHRQLFAQAAQEVERELGLS